MIINLRALGETGAAARWHRGGALHLVTPAEAAALRDERGIRVFVDLRNDPEIARGGAPAALVGAGIRWVRAPVGGYPGDAIAAARPTDGDYARYYVTMVEGARDAWRRAVAAIDAEGDTPLVFGCHAGKDRTGVLAAILLARIGASVEAIVADYARSGAAIAERVDAFRDKWEARGMTADDYAARMATPPAVMEAFLDAMDRRHDGLVRYVCGAPST